MRIRPIAPVALALLNLAACNKPSPDVPVVAANTTAGDANTTAREATDERPTLVTLELSWVGAAQRERLAARLGSTSTAAKADALLAVRHRVVAPWHIYWRNPGDAGLRTRVEVDAPAPLTAEAVLYPGPDDFLSEGGQHSYGWTDEVVLFVPITGATTGLPTSASIRVRSRWLACRESCIPGEGEVAIGPPQPEQADDPSLAAMLDRIPEPAGDRVATTWLEGPTLQLQTTAGGTLTAFFPYESEAPLLTEQAQTEAGLQLRYRLPAGANLPPAQGVVRWTHDADTRWLEIAAPWP